VRNLASIFDHTPLSRHHFEMEQHVWNLKGTCAGSALRFDDCLLCPHHIWLSSVPPVWCRYLAPPQNNAATHCSIVLQFDMLVQCESRRPRNFENPLPEVPVTSKMADSMSKVQLKRRFSTPKRNEMIFIIYCIHVTLRRLFVVTDNSRNTIVSK